jgi:hypothetical protein
MADDDIDPSALCARGSLTTADVAAIQRGYYKDGIVAEGEADALFALEQSCKVQPIEWGPLFVMAIADYLVQQVQPQGYISAENASWLTERISVEGKVQSANEFELLVRVLEDARWAPAALSTLAMAQVRDAIVEGTGPLRQGRQKPAAGIVTGDDVAALRRILYASAGEGNISVTRAEAEVLFDISDAVDESLSDPAWADLFSKAIANHLMAGSGYVAPSREEALRSEAWLAAEPDLGGFLTEMVQSGLGGIWASYHSPDAEDLALAKVEEQRRAILVNEEVTAPEAGWLADRIGRDGHVSQAERALLGFIKTNSPKIDPALSPLLAKYA